MDAHDLNTALIAAVLALLGALFGTIIWMWQRMQNRLDEVTDDHVTRAEYQSLWHEVMDQGREIAKLEGRLREHVEEEK